MTANAIEITRERIALLTARRENAFSDIERIADEIAINELRLLLSKLEHTDEPVG